MALADAEAKDFLEVIEECSDRLSIIISAQLPPGKWHEAIPNPTIADAICDRLIHSAYEFNLKGESMGNIYAKVEASSAAQSVSDLRDVFFGPLPGGYS